MTGSCALCSPPSSAPLRVSHRVLIVADSAGPPCTSAPLVGSGTHTARTSLADSRPFVTHHLSLSLSGYVSLPVVDKSIPRHHLASLHSFSICFQRSVSISVSFSLCHSAAGDLPLSPCPSFSLSRSLPSLVFIFSHLHCSLTRSFPLPTPLFLFPPHGWRNRGGTGGDIPLRAPLIQFSGWGQGDPIYNENGPFLLFLDCFSAIAIVV